MATILEFVRELLSSEDERERFEHDPRGYLAAHGFDDLSGEDVVEAVRVVVRTLPDDLARRFASYDDEGALPPIGPLFGEVELDAAVRQLEHATSLSARAGVRIGGLDVPADTDGDGGQPAEEPAADTTTTPADVPPAAAPSPPETGPITGSDAAGPDDTGPDDTGDTTAAVRHATELLLDAVHRAEQRAEAIVRQAERDAEAIRARAEAHADTARAAATDEADAIRGAAQGDAERIRDAAQQEAASIVAAANADREDAHRAVQAAADEAEAMLVDARARRDDILQTERELRERLHEMENVFRKLVQGDAVPEEQ